MKYLGLFIFILTSNLLAKDQKLIKLSTDIYFNEFEVFHPRKSALAMNIINQPIYDLRSNLENVLEQKLHFDQSWNPKGEAHILVLTASELKIINTKISLKELENLALRYDIQKSKLSILGLGSYKKDQAEIFYLIIDSYELRHIRQQIFYEFTRRGGKRSDFDPTWYFPFISIGQTHNVFNESDDVIKNLKFTYDQRFNLKISRN